AKMRLAAWSEGVALGYDGLGLGSGLEGVQEAGALLVGDFDGFPVQEIGGFFALDFAHETAAGVGAGIGGRFGHGFFQARRFPKTVDVGQRESKAALRVDVMEFEVLRFEPWMAPFQTLDRKSTRLNSSHVSI